MMMMLMMCRKDHGSSGITTRVSICKVDMIGSSYGSGTAEFGGIIGEDNGR